MCVCAYKTNGKNKKRDKKKHAKSCKAFWLTNQAREGRDRCPASPFLAARRFAVAPPGSEGLWSSGRVDQTPWNPTSGSNKPRPEGLSQSLNRINLSQEIHSPQIHGISKNGCRRTSEGKPRKDMGCIHPIVSPWNGWSHAPASFVGYIISTSVTSHEIQGEIPVKINDWSVTVLRHLPKLLGHEPSSFQASQGFWSFSALGPGLLIPLGGRLDQAGSWIGNHNR